MLDALHEDVNRVIDKPYVPAPDEDDASSGRSDQELADLAWDRHVQRNRSVIVDLFQGQLKMECRCPVCNKKVPLTLLVNDFTHQTGRSSRGNHVQIDHLDPTLPLYDMLCRIFLEYYRSNAGIMR